MTPLIFNGPTDKNDGHWHASYKLAYARLFESVRLSKNSVLEVGTDSGYPLLAYREWFQNARVFGIDVNPAPECLKNQERVTHWQRDAYTRESISELSKYGPFACLIDDGSHFLHHQHFFAEHMSKLLAEDGIGVIEDVQSYDHVPQLIGKLPKEMIGFAVDLRYADDRYDSLCLAFIRR
jgi:SAM-dependent methyltransferase